MEIIVGTIIIDNNKILMVKEGKKECRGKWAFPAGHLERNETIFEGALRETYEETGCEVTLKKVFPIIVNNEKRNIMMIHFLAKLIKGETNYSTEEILETRWFTIDELKNTGKEHFRSFTVVRTILENIDKNKLYDINMFTNIPNI